jgi:xanthine dehydrogenase accessory factor
VDVYVEPFVPARTILVVGATPVAEALARLARSMDYTVARVVDARERADVEPEAAALGVKVVALDALEDFLREQSAGHSGSSAPAVVVASQGHYDEQALESILKSQVAYVGLVASRTRGATVRALLEQSGLSGVAAIRIPAGLDLGARTPPEVALSILAEIVQAHSSQAKKDAPAGPMEAAAKTRAGEIDPVCGMTVDAATARHTAEVDGVAYYFCCANCRARFVKQPQDYLRTTP